MKKYSLTEEHRKQLKPWVDKWIANVMSTKQMDENDKQEMRSAIAGIYEAAKLPQPKNIVFVQSPLVASIVGGISAGIWYLRKSNLKILNAIDDATDIVINVAARNVAINVATRNAIDNAIDAVDAATRNAIDVATLDATLDATRIAINVTTRDATDAVIYAVDAATRNAIDVATYVAINAATDATTRDATDAVIDAVDAATFAATFAATLNTIRDATFVAINIAIDAATRDATIVATRDATRDATIVATRDATRDAIDAATRDATRDATIDAIDAATKNSNTETNETTRFLLSCYKNYFNMWNGGNQWSGWIGFLSFFKDVVKLDLKEYNNYSFYERAAVFGGPRMVHSDFCVVSDRPEILKVDENNRPHCDDGPSHKWRDGWCLYHWHGVKVDRKVIEEPENITLDSIDSEVNAEVRRIKILRRGVSWYLTKTKAELVDVDSRNCVGGATRALFKDKNGECWLCGTDGSTKRVYYMPVDNGVLSCRDAHESICGFGEGSIVAES